MNDLKIHHWDGSKRTVRFVGYNRAHTALFIRDEQNARQAITLQLPDHFKLLFRQNPIGIDGSPPVEINRVALHLPAFFATREEKEAFGSPRSREFLCALASYQGVWKRFTIHKCHLELKDDEKLQLLLNEEQARMRWCYEIASRETDEQIAGLAPGDTIAAEALRTQLRDKFTTLTDGTDGKSIPISVFDVTLDMVRRGWGDLRAKYMEGEWAKSVGLDLRTIPINAAAFRVWLKASAFNARQSVFNSNTGIVTNGHCLELHSWQWEAIEASVCYEVRYADGTRCWLDDIVERDVTDPQEAEDFERLEGANLKVTGNQQAEDAAQPAASVPFAIPDSRFEYVNLQGTEWRKAGPHMVRRGEFAEQQRTTTKSSGFRSLLELHRDRWFYPVKQINEVRRAAEAGDDCPVAAMFDITDWDSNWHPPSAPNWTHPGKKSAASGQIRVNQV